MVYTRQEWRDYPSGGTAISAARLNHIEQGIDDAHTLIGSGSTPTNPTDPGTSADNVSGFWNAKTDFKCAGDGTTNDAVALNLGLDLGGYIYLPPGDYLCNQELDMYSTTPTYLFGPGRLVSTNNDAIIRVNNAAHVIDGIRIQGGGSSLNNQGGIIVYSNFCVIKNTDIKGLARFGIFMQGNYGRIEGNWLNHCSLGTITDSPSVATIFVSGDHVKTTQNHLSDTEWGITYRGESYTNPIVGGLIEGNTLYCAAGAPATTQGISSAYPQHQRIVGNHVANYPNNCIDQYGGQYTVIANNTLYKGQHDGIFVGHQDTKAVSITGNTIRECSTGIRAWDHSQQVDIVGNNVSNCGWGVVAQGSVNTGEQDLSNIRVEANQITLNTTTGGVGIAAKSINGLAVNNNTVVNAAHQGIYVDDVIYIHCVDNQVKGAGADPTGTWAAIEFTAACSQGSVNGNFCVGSADLAIKLAGDKWRVVGNRWDNIAIGISTGTATNIVQSDNVAW